ncbi:Uncharacterized protein HSRCO_1853 [Halanaeroarchaeum sp. HSR-CO]|nr:Uncharacterized protein HSRCO_1853 [Halanaeroarchaeum sp. HSR-CO]
MSRIPEDIEFVAMAITPFHARGIRAAALKYDLSKGIILIKPHLADGYLLEKNDFSYLDDDINVFYWDDIFEDNFLSWMLLNISSTKELLHQNLSDSGNILYIIAPMKPDINLLSIGRHFYEYFSPQFITIDEGFGTYIKQEEFRKINRKDRLRKFDLDSGLRQVVADTVGQIHKLIESRLLQQFTIKTFHIFSLEDSKLSVNDDIAGFYRQTFHVEKSIQEYDCIIITQPFGEASDLSENDELSLIHDIISQLPGDSHIGIKPHPRETEDKYESIQSRYDSVEVLAKSIPVEEIYDISDPDSVVGFTSTALLTAAAIFDIQSYTAANLLRSYTSSDRLCDNIDHFLNLTENIVTIL